MTARRWLVLRPLVSGYHVAAAAEQLEAVLPRIEDHDIVAVMRDARPPTLYRRTYPRMFVRLFADELWLDVGPLIRIPVPLRAGQYLRRSVVRALTCPDRAPRGLVAGGPVAVDANDPPCRRCNGVGDARRGMHWFPCPSCSRVAA